MNTEWLLNLLSTDFLFIGLNQSYLTVVSIY